jgi:dTMP kinase
MKFIVFEGLDGSGKTTQLKRLAEKLGALGKPYIKLRQPSDNPIGTLTRTTTDGILGMENEAIALLLAADRYQQAVTEIAPALAAGKYVLLDRYYYSSFAFQGVDAGIYARLAAYNGLVMAGHKPDVIFFLDTSPEECMRRITAGRADTGLYESLAQMAAVRERYTVIFNQLQSTDNTVFINGDDGEEAIAARIFGCLDGCLDMKE